MRVVTTLLPATAGSVRVFGVDVSKCPMQVRRLLDVPRARRRDVVSEMLEAVGLADAADRLVSTYSGGMIRRLELAQALVNRPRLLVLDEPTIGLDPIAREGVWARIADLRAGAGMTVLLTTHYLEEANELCDRVALMHHGRLQAVGSPGQLEAALGPGATLDDVFRRYASDAADTNGDMRQVRQTRRTAGRLG